MSSGRAPSIKYRPKLCQRKWRSSQRCLVGCAPPAHERRASPFCNSSRIIDPRCLWLRPPRSEGSGRSWRRRAKSIQCAPRLVKRAHYLRINSLGGVVVGAEMVAADLARRQLSCNPGRGRCPSASCGRGPGVGSLTCDSVDEVGRHAPRPPPAALSPGRLAHECRAARRVHAVQPLRSSAVALRRTLQRRTLPRAMRR